MEKYKRATIAALTFSFLRKVALTAIYDYDLKTYHRFLIEAKNVPVRVYDYQRLGYLVGNRAGENSWNLYDYPSGFHISLTINLQDYKFNGYDFQSRKHFTGNLVNNQINFYDYDDGTYHLFSS